MVSSCLAKMRLAKDPQSRTVAHLREASLQLFRFGMLLCSQDLTNAVLTSMHSQHAMCLEALVDHLKP
jgi:hypothetical protein